MNLQNTLRGEGSPGPRATSCTTVSVEDPHSGNPQGGKASRGCRGWGMTASGVQLPFGVMTMLWNEAEVTGHNMLNGLSAVHRLS